MTGDNTRLESVVPSGITLVIKGKTYYLPDIHYVGIAADQTAAMVKPVVETVQKAIGSGRGSYELELVTAAAEDTHVSGIISEQLMGNHDFLDPDLIDREPLGDDQHLYGWQTRLYYQTSVWSDDNAIDIPVTQQLLRPLRSGLYRFLVISDKPTFGKRIQSIGFSWLSKDDIDRLGQRRAEFNEHLLPNLNKRLDPQEIRDLSGFVTF